MTIKKTAILLVASLALALAACTSDTPPNSESVSGSASSSETSLNPDESSTVPAIELPGVSAENYPAVDGSTANMPLLAAMYSRICGVSLDQAETMVSVSGGTGAVWNNMMYGGAELLVVYEAPESIKAEMEEMGVLDELDITPIGRDGLVFLVNTQNPVDSLTRQQLIDIYTGQVTDWSEVGGDSGPIAAFQRNLESGSQTLFLGLLMQGVEPMEPPTELRPAGMGGLIDAVADYDGSGDAIGFSVYYYANLMYENPSLKLLAVDGIEPSATSIGDGSYPLINDFYVVIRKDAPEDSPARLLRDWLLSDAGRQLLVDNNYVPIG